MAETPDRPLLTRLRVQNFRSLADVTVEFGPLTVLVGPNGAGKSNVVDALRFLRDASAEGLAQALIDRGGIAVLRRRSKGEPLDVSIEIEVQGPGWGVDYKLILSGKEDAEHQVRRERMSVMLQTEHSQRNTLRLTAEIADGQWSDESGLLEPYSAERFATSSGGLAFLGRSGDLTFLILETADGQVDQPRRPYSSKAYGFVKRIQSSAFYGFAPSGLRAPQRLLTRSPLNEEGKNLSAVLGSLSDDPDADTMHAALGQLVDGVIGYRVRNVGSYLVTELLYKNGEGGEPIPSELAQESDGTLRMLGILAALYQRPPLPLVVIEEPETNIHPGALGVLADVFEEASLRSQILITTHSPDLVDRFPPEALRVVERVNGETKVGPVREGQHEAVKKKLFSPGELMRMQGLQREEDEA